MKKSILILCLWGILPAVVTAVEQDAGGHTHQKENNQMMPDHKMNGMEGMGHDEHASQAGNPGNPASVNQTVEILMEDNMRFSPDQIKVQAGTTVRFLVRNNGKLAHEMVIGTTEELKKHADMMREMPEMTHVEPNMIRLNPGQRGSLVWQFDTTGSVNFACLVPGHFEAGMSGSVDIQTNGL